MKIFLVQPNSPSFPCYTLPVGIGYLSEMLLSEGIDHEVFDLNFYSKKKFFDKIRDQKPEFIGVSLFTLDISFKYQLINEIKKKFGVKIIAGGPHISFIKKKALEECPSIDFGVVSEGEYRLIRFLKGEYVEDIDGFIYRDRKGRIQCNTSEEFINDLDPLPFPKYSKMDLSKYWYIPIGTVRGCAFSCTFCGAKLSMGNKWRLKSAQKVAEEIRYWYERGYKSFSFEDNESLMRSKRVSDILNKIRNLEGKISIHVAGARATTINKLGDEIIKRFKRIGLKSLEMGIECANDDVLKNIKKNETVDDMKRAMELLERNNIDVSLYFIIGLPGQTIRHVFNSFKFALQYKNINYVEFMKLVPLDGTEIYQWALNNGYLLDFNSNKIYESFILKGNKISVATPYFPRYQQIFANKIAKIIAFLVSKNHKYKKKNTFESLIKYLIFLFSPINIFQLIKKVFKRLFLK